LEVTAQHNVHRGKITPALTCTSICQANRAGASVAPDPRSNAGTVVVGLAAFSISFFAQAAEDNKEQFFGIIRLA